MTTAGILVEDRPISVLALMRAPVVTSTGEETEGPVLSQSSVERLWRIIDAAPSRSRVDQAVYHFAKNVWTVPSVVAVTHARDRNVNLVWTFITYRDKAVRARIYARERELMERYPDVVFDFYVVALDQGAYGVLVPEDIQGRVVLYRPLG